MQSDRIPCRDLTCNKTFSSRQNEWKHSKKKHPEMIGSIGIALTPHIPQIEEHNLPNYQEHPDEELGLGLFQPNNEEPGFGFDSNNDDMAVNNVLPILDVMY